MWSDQGYKSPDSVCSMFHTLNIFLATAIPLPHQYYLCVLIMTNLKTEIVRLIWAWRYNLRSGNPFNGRFNFLPIICCRFPHFLKLVLWTVIIEGRTWGLHHVCQWKSVRSDSMVCCVVLCVCLRVSVWQPGWHGEDSVGLKPDPRKTDI
jgi:hypothetical protein